MRKFACQAGAIAMVLSGLAGSTAGEVSVARPQPRVERIYAACVSAMLKNTCSVTNDRSQSSAATDGDDAVFVAGVGAINAASYRRIRAYGERMCTQVRQACETAPGGAECATAFSLWAG